MKELVGRDLAGWKLEIWWELRLSRSDRDGNSDDIGGYFSDRDSAVAYGVGKGWWGGHGTAHEVLVMTTDGETGYVVSELGDRKKKLVSKKDEDRIRKELIVRAMSKLTPEEQRLLNLS